MDEAEKLANLLDKLKKNKEKVPQELLKSKYKNGYDKLCGDIKSYVDNYLKYIVLEDIRIDKHDVNADEASKIFDKIYKQGGYPKRIGTALYNHYSVQEAESLAREINIKYKAALLDKGIKIGV